MKGRYGVRTVPIFLRVSGTQVIDDGECPVRLIHDTLKSDFILKSNMCVLTIKMSNFNHLPSGYTVAVQNNDKYLNVSHFVLLQCRMQYYWLCM